MAPPRAQPTPKGLATPSLPAQIATAKHADARPLHRLEKNFQRIAIDRGRATMASRFDEALRGQKKQSRPGSKQSVARLGPAQINKLYEVERGHAEVTVEPRQALWAERLAPGLENLRGRLDSPEERVPPGTLTGEAVAFLDSQASELVRVLDVGCLPPGTNAVERAIPSRPSPRSPRSPILGIGADLHPARPNGARGRSREASAARVPTRGIATPARGASSPAGGQHMRQAGGRTDDANGVPGSR